MSKRRALLAAGIFNVPALALLIVPVLVRQAMPEDERILHGVGLADTKYEEVRFRNESADLDLGGMLFVPEGDGPFPAVVVIHGAGTSRRDNPWYLTFVSDLQEHGIAVLLPDKRGSEQSGGDWRSASFEDLALDTEAAVAFLRSEYGDTITDIGVLGASQGGQVAPIAGTRTDEVGFVINVVGTAPPFHQALVFEENNNLREIGVLPGVSNALARVTSWHIRTVAQKEFWNAVGNYDPLPYWQRVSVPALIMLGADDTNTPTETSVRNLNALANPNLTVVVWPGSGHPLEDPVGAGTSYFREDALVLMREFIDRATVAPFEQQCHGGLVSPVDRARNAFTTDIRERTS